MGHKTQEELLAADRHSLRFPHYVWAAPGGGFQHSSWYGGVKYVRDDVHAAALSEAQAEIARLREALRSIAANTCCEGCQEAARVARAVLSPREGEG